MPTPKSTSIATAASVPTLTTPGAGTPRPANTDTHPLAATPVPTPKPTAKPVPVPNAATPLATAAPTSPSFTWPHWSHTARIAGSAFHLEDTEEDIDAALDDLAEQQVSVVLADSPWGWSYTAWMDDTEFYAVRDMMETVVKKAHARGLRVVMYQTGLELTSQPGPKPDVENPDWLQRALDGETVFFNDITSTIPTCFVLI